MTTKKAIEKAIPVYVCPKEDELKRNTVLLERLSYVTLGNGTPENGLLFMFREFLEVDKRRKEDIADIKKDLKDSLDASAKAVKAIEIYKAEMGGVDSGMRDIIDRQTIKSRDTWYKVLTLLGIICAIFFGFKSNKKAESIEMTTNKTQNKIETLTTGDSVLYYIKK